MKTYRQSIWAHVATLAGGLFFGACAVVGGIGFPTSRYQEPHDAFALIALGLGSLFCFYLYFTSVIQRYEITEKGLRVHRLFRSTFHPWHEITTIKVNDYSHTFFVRGKNGLIFYASTDGFPHLEEFLHTLHLRRG